MCDVKVNLSNDGIIEILVQGDQTVASVQSLGDEAIRLGQLQVQAGKPCLILDNLVAVGHVPAEARKLVVDLVKSTEYDKLAMVGSNPMIRLGANLMLQATGKGDKVRYFDDRPSAIAWLKS